MPGITAVKLAPTGRAEEPFAVPRAAITAVPDGATATVRARNRPEQPVSFPSGVRTVVVTRAFVLTAARESVPPIDVAVPVTDTEGVGSPV